MVRRHPDFESLKTVDEARWLVVSNMTGKVLGWMVLAPRENLRKRFSEVVAATYAAGWDVEEFDSRSGGFFCRKGAERRYIAIQPTPPTDRSGLWRLPDSASEVASCVGV